MGDPRRSLEILLARSVTASRSRKTPDHLSAIQPPTVAHLTVRNRLRPARHLGVFAREGENRRSFIGCRTVLPSRASGTFSMVGEGSRGCARCHHVSPFLPVRVNAAGFIEPEVPSAEEVLAWTRFHAAFEGRRHRWPTGAIAARVHRSSKASTRPS